MAYISCLRHLMSSGGGVWAIPEGRDGEEGVLWVEELQWDCPMVDQCAKMVLLNCKEQSNPKA